jgi:hypothetical protein
MCRKIFHCETLNEDSICVIHFVIRNETDYSEANEIIVSVIDVMLEAKACNAGTMVKVM